jgi:hypothetical protein
MATTFSFDQKMMQEVANNQYEVLNAETIVCIRNNDHLIACLQVTISTNVYNDYLIPLKIKNSIQLQTLKIICPHNQNSKERLLTLLSMLIHNCSIKDLCLSGFNHRAWDVFEALAPLLQNNQCRQSNEFSHATMIQIRM